MVRIAPIRLSFNPKTLWFDAGDLELGVNDDVVVTTVRGEEFGTVASALFELGEDEMGKVKSPLKPVKRIATEHDCARNDEMAEKSSLALPIFKQIAKECIPDMNPVAVEYLFSGDKAVFYFESEERVDFRDLVRKLAAELHVRVDMKQIGVRDEARLIGGLGHCGQELCCRRLGGGFDPVSIRMAKEQDLSLNPQKISGVCGRLMCCLRYEYEAYKDFHGRAPKKNAKIQTPEGEGKVVDLNVPKEIVSIKVGDEKPVKVPLCDFEEASDGSRPNVIGDDAWARANEPVVLGMETALNLFTSELSGDDKLAEPGKVRHVHEEQVGKKKPRSRRRGSGGSSVSEKNQETEQKTTRKPRRRRSTTVASDGTTKVSEEKPQDNGAEKKHGQQETKKSSSRRRSRSRSNSKQGQQKDQQPTNSAQQNTGSKVGRNSSALRAGRQETSEPTGEPKPSREGSTRRRRRRPHKDKPETAE